MKYFVTQLNIRKEFSSKTLFDVDAAIEDLQNQEKTLKAKKVKTSTLRACLYDETLC